MSNRPHRNDSGKIGLLEWFHIWDFEHVEKVLADLRALGVTELRTGISWADWHAPRGERWYQWLIPHLAQEVNVLPCVLYTPPSLGIVPKASSPPRKPKAYADFIDIVITELGDYFDWIELWNEPNNISEWDWTIDPEWHIFCEMIGGAAYWAQQCGKKTVLAGMSPIDPNWLELMLKRGVVEYIDAVGIHGFPGVWEQSWGGWTGSIGQIRQLLRRYQTDAEVWITETGYSTWQHDEYGQLRAFTEALDAPTERLYWYSVYDLHPDLPTVDGFHSDDREYAFGLKRVNGQPKLLYRLWADGGLPAVRKAAQPTTFPSYTGDESEKHTLITGGAGFIGTNLADRLLSAGEPVLIYDNLSRPGVEQNLQWLCERHRDLVQVEIADIRNRFMLRDAVRRSKKVFHLAAQVAVTTSLEEPVSDFEINAQGTLNLLEALRSLPEPPPLVFTSTNKVYGGLEDLSLLAGATRYEPADKLFDSRGISETQTLAFHSPYGCSKGTADQYVLDYARIYDLPTVVFRMSCIYGPHQFGTEDQGWVAHFLIQALNNQPIIIFGDGKQVRDILFVDDLVDAFLLAQENIDLLSGQAFNIGGGPPNTTSLLELIELISQIQGREPRLFFDRWRPGDQRYYVSDTRKFQDLTGWNPQVKVRQGVERLYQWLLQAHSLPMMQLAPLEVAVE